MSLCVVPQQVLFLDTETTGLDARVNGLLTVGLVKWENGCIKATKEIFVDPGDCQVNPSSMLVNGINLTEHRQKAVSKQTALTQMSMWIGQHFDAPPPTPGGHNIGFDLEFLKQIAPKETLDTMLSHRAIDLVGIIKAMYIAGIIDEDVSSSSAAYKYFCITNAQEHNAVCDAMADAELFSRLLSILSKRGM